MGQPKRNERILGPYADRAGFRVISIDATGKRGATVFDTAAKAERHIELLRAELAREDPTTETTIEEYA